MCSREEVKQEVLESEKRIESRLEARLHEQHQELHKMLTNFVSDMNWRQDEQTKSIVVALQEMRDAFGKILK